MHPAFSVLFFTVTSGMGYGFLLCLILARSLGWLSVSDESFVQYSGLATAIATLGLMSSTFHLANPKNAWRSFMRFRTSWLSREGVLAIVIYPVLMIYLGLVWTGFSHVIEQVLGGILLLLIVALTICTGMIYASLKTIPQWHHRLVPINFSLFTLCSGLLCFAAVLGQASLMLSLLLIVMFLLSMLSKLAYFVEIGKPSMSNINTATSFSQAAVTLFDSGHSHENFLQREFVYQVGPKTTALARKMVVIFAFLLPIILVAISAYWGGSKLFVWGALISAYLGLLLERWLFFVEAKHVVRHYYGVT